MNVIRARLAAIAVLSIVVVAGLAPSLSAWQPAQGSSQDEFVPVRDLPGSEQLPAAPLLIAAYVVVWLVLLVYVWSLWRRIGAVGRDLDELARRIREQGQPS